MARQNQKLNASRLDFEAQLGAAGEQRRQRVDSTFPPSPLARGRGGLRQAKKTRNAHSCSVTINEDVRKYAAEQGIAEEEAPGMEAKSKVFVEKGAEVYARRCNSWSAAL